MSRWWRRRRCSRRPLSGCHSSLVERLHCALKCYFRALSSERSLTHSRRQTVSTLGGSTSVSTSRSHCISRSTQTTALIRRRYQLSFKPPGSRNNSLIFLASSSHFIRLESIFGIAFLTSPELSRAFQTPRQSLGPSSLHQSIDQIVKTDLVKTIYYISIAYPIIAPSSNHSTGAELISEIRES